MYSLVTLPHLAGAKFMMVVVYVHMIKPTKSVKIPSFCGKNTHATQIDFFVSEIENLKEKTICLRMSEDKTPLHEKEHNKNTLKM